MGGRCGKSMGDIVITHYGLESGLVYKQGRALRAAKQLQPLVLTLDLLPDVTVQKGGCTPETYEKTVFK